MTSKKVDFLKLVEKNIIYNREYYDDIRKGSCYNQFFEKKDYDGLINLGNVIIELIGFIRLDIVLMDQNSV